MAVTWTISSMDRDIKQGDKADIVTTIHWRASETDSDGNIGSDYSSINVTLGSQSFIAYADIKESDAIQWAKDALGEDEVKKIPTVCGSLREAMESLDKDRDFLKQGNVFTDDQIDAYIALKFEEIHNFEHTPHPIEFDMYYSC